MNNITELKHDDSTQKEYRLYKVEVIVEENELEAALEGLVALGVTPAIYYQVS